jgi:hypothetical protein
MNHWDHLPNSLAINSIVDSTLRHTTHWGRVLHPKGTMMKNCQQVWQQRGIRSDDWYNFDDSCRLVQQVGGPIQEWHEIHNMCVFKRLERPCFWGGVAPGKASEAAGRRWQVAKYPLLALVLNDDIERYLTMDYQELKLWSRLSQDFNSTSLLPASMMEYVVNPRAWKQRLKVQG